MPRRIKNSFKIQTLTQNIYTSTKKYRCKKDRYRREKLVVTPTYVLIGGLVDKIRYTAQGFFDDLDDFNFDHDTWGDIEVEDDEENFNFDGVATDVVGDLRSVLRQGFVWWGLRDLNVVDNSLVMWSVKEPLPLLTFSETWSFDDRYKHVHIASELDIYFNNKLIKIIFNYFSQYVFMLYFFNCKRCVKITIFYT